MKQLIFLSCFLQISGSLFSQKQLQQMQDSPAAYSSLGLLKDSIQLWEDGSRISTAKGNYEVWYYRANLEDSSVITIFFFMRDFKKINRKSISPYVGVEIELASGKKIYRNIRCKANEYTSSKTQCDVHIGKNYLTGDLKNYKIHIDDSVIKMDIAFESTIQPWRQKTGILNFGNKGKNLGWFIPVPEGKTKVTYTINGNTTSTKGTCFHDNSWSNQTPVNQFDHWQWSLSELGPYKVYIAEIIANKKYKYEPHIYFAIFKDGKILVDDETKVVALRSIGIKEPLAHKPVSDTYAFTYTDGNTNYKIMLKKKRFIISNRFINNRLLSKSIKLLTGFDGAWYRLECDATLNVYKEDCLKETYTSTKSIWELFYFGNPL